MIDEENQLGGAQHSTVGSSDAATAESFEGQSEDATPDAQVDVQTEAATVVDSANGADVAGSVGNLDTDQQTGVIAELQNEIAALRAQVEERTGQCVRIAADFDNYRKRTQREREDLEQQVKCSTINELLPVVDNFERARSHIKPQTDQETTIHKSYQSVYKQLVDCLKRIGVAPMRSEGKEFDPNLHEAVMRQPSDEYPEGTVLEELQRGYMLGERVLRHALVKVAAAPEPAAVSDESDQGVQDG
ncbi:nucleotide exchange factor GrpE [Leptolyngbya sp. FACHB-36]|uniref:nucleotide exchange factor GrpE n=1 Tax=Leptolyngbya sp. FACHB-36 TaxID=2692808 RepID=UPI0016800CF9|nr:nucleotide exchange factor GrpE [Leptolyngbya sp. FACHB-36]MBD2019830.1 nucleotide exchange factor GrpE [Leptolyngbya sp. FACHB-36]